MLLSLKLNRWLEPQQGSGKNRKPPQKGKQRLDWSQADGSPLGLALSSACVLCNASRGGPTASGFPSDAA